MRLRPRIPHQEDPGRRGRRGDHRRRRDGLELVGRVAGHEAVWVAAGYSGNGNVLGLMRGELVAQAILGSPALELAILDPAG